MSDSPNNRIFATGSDTLINDVNHTIQGSGQLGINNAGFGFTLTNSGTIIANQTNQLNIAPSSNVTNNGTIQVNAGSSMQVISPSFTQNAGKTQVDGTMSVSSGELVANGTVLGTGTINGDITLTGGTIIAGMPGTPGTLTINGSYAQTGTSVYDELISSNTTNGLLDVSGLATLDPSSLLNITLLGGFDPSGKSFTIVDYGSFNGGTFSITDPTFNGGTQQWVISSYNGGDGDDIVLTAEAASPAPTPEPGTLILLGTGLLGVCGYLSRKRTAPADYRLGGAGGAVSNDE
jgi:hypothetical protein